MVSSQASDCKGIAHFMFIPFPLCSSMLPGSNEPGRLYLRSHFLAQRTHNFLEQLVSLLREQCILFSDLCHQKTLAFTLHYFNGGVRTMTQKGCTSGLKL